MGSSGRILIVDDDPSLLEAVSAALDPPYAVLTVRTGAGALEVIASQTLDLVLLDYRLPDISGLILLRAIKRLFPSVLVILMTGYGSEEVSVDSFRGGARDYLKKPIVLADLLARVEKLLAARHGSVESRASVLLDSGPGGPELARAPRAADVKRAVDFIEEHLGDALTLDVVSHEAGMSKFRFCRHFKTVTGLTFREYLARQRIARATELLRDGSRSVTEVYLEVGFKDPTHFGRVFRRITGQLPSVYRRGVIGPPRD